MLLRIDSSPPIVWRDPFSLQFGVDPVRAVLRDVTSAEEQMVAALVGGGITRQGLVVLAKNSGAGERDVASLLDRLDPLLAQAAAPGKPARVSIAGRGPTAERITELLLLAGIRATLNDLPDADCDLGIAVGHYVLEPSLYGFWLRRDLPHLPILFGDDAATIGPLVEPGTTACLYCLEHHRRDADESWAAIAAQLWGRRAPSETPLTSIEVTASVVRMVRARLAGEPATAATSLRVFVATGATTARTWLPHPDCGCIGMSEPRSANESGANEGRPETDSGLALVRPRTIAIVGARE